MRSSVRQGGLRLAYALLVFGVCAPAQAKKRSKTAETETAVPSNGSGVATVAPTNAAEKRAAKYSRTALRVDVMDGHYLLAEGRLREAIHQCELTCSAQFVARLHRDLGYLYATIMERPDAAQDEFATALSMDPTVALAPAMQDPQTIQAFNEAASRGAGDKTAKRKAAESESDETVLDADAPPDATPTEFSAPPPQDSNADNATDSVLNWISLSIQQDWVYHSKTPDACSQTSPYHCYDSDKILRTLEPGQFGGNQISSGGALPGTLRVLVGVDRVVSPHVSLGLRLGSVVSGKATTVSFERRFMYFHGEGRLALWFGPEPFARAGLRPYIFLSGGFAEADGRIVVDFNVPGDPNTYKLDAWKRSGSTFVSSGLGIQAAFTKHTGPVVEARYMQFLSPNVPVLGLQLGYAVGF